jgi:glycosyltransferase involved in cell wall biosynthesis
LDEHCATFVDPRSTTQIAEALQRLLCDERGRRALAKTGYERVQRYSWDLVAERHLARYESLLRRDSIARRQPQL